MRRSRAHFIKKISKGPHIEYIGVGGAQKGFARAMKNFRQILMDHEIFLKFFDGPQNIFLCASFFFFEYTASFKKLLVLSTKCSN